MPDDETIQSEAAETETEVDESVTGDEGGDSLNADAGDDQEGVGPDSPAGERSDGEWVPRSRLNEVIQERNALRENMTRKTAEEWQNFQSRRQEEKPADPVFDEDTDRRLEQFIQRKVGSQQELTQTELVQVKAALNEMKVAKQNKDWDELKPDVGDLYNKAAASGFSGTEFTQMLIDAARYRSGRPVQEAVAQARRREDAKARAAGPSGSAPRSEESEPDFDEMSDDDFRKLVSRTLHS